MHVNIYRHASVYSLASEIIPPQPMTHKYSYSNSIPCSNGYTLSWLSCTKLYRNERWGRPHHANREELLTSMAMNVCVCEYVFRFLCVIICVCARVCVHVPMSQTEH